MRRLRVEKLILIFAGLPIYLLSLLMPKRNDLWLFGAWFGGQYSDNSKYLYEQTVRSSNGTVEAWWITKDRDIEKRLREAGSNVALAYSLKGLWLQMRARVFVCCVNSLDFSPPCITVRNFFVQLWHGAPLKSILLQTVQRYSLRYWLMQIRFVFVDRYDLVLSPSEFTDVAFSAAFGMPVSKMFRAGYPRCDELISAAVSIQDVKQALGVGESKVWFYLPTHRQEGRMNGESNKRIVECLQRVAQEFEDQGIVLIVKPHPYEKEHFAEISAGDSVRVLTELPYDLYTCLSAADGLVTDYSSVAFDFAVCGRPIVFFPYDEDEYQQSDRALAYPLDEVSEFVVRVPEKVPSMIGTAWRRGGTGLRLDISGQYSSPQAPIIVAEIAERVLGA